MAFFNLPDAILRNREALGQFVQCRVHGELLIRLRSAVGIPATGIPKECVV
jgi:hypothetical protein